MRALITERTPGFRGAFTDADYRDVQAFYADNPTLRATPLHTLPSLARDLGLGSVWIKDETGRFGINAFKIVGVRYAAHRLGDARLARGLICATAGNHGRAVARVARDKGVPCTVFVPAARPDAHATELHTRSSRVGAMRADGAQVVEVNGSYEDAVARAAEHGAVTGGTVLSDTSWPGYEEIPRWIMAGYTQVFEECAAAWEHTPSAVLVQGGVGGLVCAAVSWFAWRFGDSRPLIVACEPDGAACLLESAATGRAVSLPGPLDTIMAGLRCGEPSAAAWPAIRDGVDAFISIPDALTLEAIGRLQAADATEVPISAGPSGACGVAAMLGLMRAPALTAARASLKLDRSSHVLAVVTEGP